MLNIVCVLETFNYKCLMKFDQNSKVIKLNKCMKKKINEIIKKINVEIEKVNIYTDNFYKSYKLKLWK